MRAMSNTRFRLSLIGLTVCVLASFLALTYPVYVIRPFRHQGAQELAAALIVLRFRPFLQTTCILATITIVIFSWNRMRGWWRKTVLVLSTLCVVLFGLLSRVNIYEQMFHPLKQSVFTLVAKAKLDGGEEVLAVKIHGAARAYPVRNLSYHHIVNDVLGGLPIVATY